MTYRRQTARFHIKTGPPILFERVQFILQERRTLKVHAPHLRMRGKTRSAPLELIIDFDPDEWELRTAEVDVKSGKWINSAWTRLLKGRPWWIVIGIGDVLMKVIDTDKFGLGPDIVKSGAMYTHVEAVNQRLMPDSSTG